MSHVFAASQACSVIMEEVFAGAKMEREVFRRSCVRWCQVVLPSVWVKVNFDVFRWLLGSS